MTNLISLTVEEVATRLEELIDKLESGQIDRVHIANGDQEVMMIRYTEYRDISE